ncbi:glycosyltransferase WbuB [Chryseobacterium glaciei]|uniref:Glycosyltransferase WbuB n=1 Tax=Chryseobacterium glaciei TaxID=1685010 RepID=A0A172XXC9_9FLAO|nr:glycosyltransferase family 4 protein [Chryseobacterium glaciei]ANF51556.1 glycosyltransferase WbuB [Chryseobacterium glaciei]
MNVLFLTLVKIETLQQRSIYHDLMREFSNHGHNLYIVSPTERREKQKSTIKTEGSAKFLNVRTLNIQKTNFIEKGLSTISIEKLFLRAIKKKFSDVKFDLILYSTPPITFTNLIKYFRERDNAKTYLLLKDIFPQNAVDMKFISKKGMIYRYFRNKEKDLYNISDKIGCMSKANADYVLNHNPYIPNNKVEINPNSIEIQPFNDVSNEDEEKIKAKYKIPDNRKIFIYGGSLGKPQGIEFLLQTLEAKKNDERLFFIIVGSGTEYNKIENWVNINNPQNTILLSALPKSDYDLLIRVCNVGLIFLHKDFTIPNYPSRLLSYLEFKMPIIAATDNNTDIGTDIMNNGCGISVYSDDINQMTEAINSLIEMAPEKFEEMRQKSWDFLVNDFKVEDSYQKIINIK